MESSVEAFLAGLGLGKYAEAFAREDVTSWETLCALSEADLRDSLGMSLGHRRTLLAAIAERSSSQQKSSQQEAAAAARVRELEAEVARLTGRVQELESGLDYDPHRVKVVHVERNPVVNAEVSRLTAENAALRAQLRASSASVAPPPQQQQQQVDPDKHAQRLKELFAAQIRTFREFVFAALGWQITETRLHEYHLLSLYAERRQDEIVLTFDNGRLQLVETDFALRQRANEAVWGWLARGKSIPGFLAQLNLQLLESTTVV